MKKAIFMGFMFFLFFSAFSQENLEYQIPPEEIPEGPDVPVPLSVKKEVEGNNKKCLEKEIYREMNTTRIEMYAKKESKSFLSIYS